MLEGERTVVNKKLQDLKTENQQMSREIQRNKMFNKKDEERKAKKEVQDKLRAEIADDNKAIEDHDINLDKEKRKLDDRNLLKKQQEITR